MSNESIDFCICPFYYFTVEGKMYRTNDVVHIALNKNDEDIILDIMECLITIYDMNNYNDAMTLTDVKLILEEKLTKFWHKFIENVVNNTTKDIKSWIGLVVNNVEDLINSVHTIFVCKTFLRKLKCDFRNHLTIDNKKTVISVENKLEEYWNIFDDILFFRPVFACDQNLIILSIQIYILQYAKKLNTPESQERLYDVNLEDAIFNRFGCFIQHWLLQGKDNNISNVYNTILGNDFFIGIAHQLRRYIAHDRKEDFRVHISPSMKLKDDSMYRIIINPKKGFFKYSMELINFVNETIKNSLKEKFHMNDNILGDLQFTMIAIYLLYKGFCESTSSVHERHLNVLKTHCIMQLNTLITNKDNILDKCINVILSENFVCKVTFDKWVKDHYLILLLNLFREKHKYDKKGIISDKNIVIHK